MLYRVFSINHTMANITEQSTYESIESSESLIIYKISLIFFLFVVTFTFGFLPLKVSYFKSNVKMIGIANSFSGGIFLTVALLHMLPESTEIFHGHLLVSSENTNKQGPGMLIHSGEYSHFPLSFLIAICGYSSILFLEKVLFDHSHAHEEDDENEKEEEENNNNNNNNNSTLDIYSSQSVKNKTIDLNTINERQLWEPKKPPSGQGGISENYSFTISNISKISKSRSREKISEYFTSFRNETSDKHEQEFKQYFSTTGKISKLIVTKSKKDAEKSLRGTLKETLLRARCSSKTVITKKYESGLLSNIVHGPDAPDKATTSLTSYLLLIALSIHACFEGIAIGLQNSGSEMFYMFIAIALHKWVEALSIGINLNKSKIPKGAMCNSILLFSLMTPFGILCGIIFSGFSKIVEAFFLSISAGTFIYISASEVVIEEFSVSQYKIEKFCGFLFGALIIFVLSFLEH